MSTNKGRPSPAKRRRTDNGPTVVANSIAQTNNTLAFLTGHGSRQNRWMSGEWQPLVRPREGGGTTAQIVNYDIPQLDGTADGNSLEGTIHNGTAFGSANNDSARHDSLSSSHNATAARSKAAESPNISGNLTQVANIPGLPSPATSDDTVFHPNSHFGSMTPSNAPGSVRQPIASGDDRQVNARLARPMHATEFAGQHGPQGRPQNAAVSGRTTDSRVLGPFPLPPRAVLPSQPAQHTAAQPVPSTALPQQQQKARIPKLHPTYMHQRMEAFQKGNIPFSNVDRGLLQLLQEAIAQQDYFYIVLSQIHALTKDPEHIPTTAQALAPTSFRYLSQILCSTDSISPPVLKWLQHFPSSVVKIYFGAERDVYETYVRQVVEFLQLLPRYWDSIVHASRQRDAPPLVQNLHDILHLPSPVLQTSAFRAIARMLFRPQMFTDADTALRKVELLHQLDQTYFRQVGRRSEADKELAYRAFRLVKVAWKAYENAHNGQPPNVEQAPFIYPVDAVKPFQFPDRQQVAIAPGVGEQNATAMRQYHEMQLNAQRLAGAQQAQRTNDRRASAILPSSTTPTGAVAGPVPGNPLAQAQPIFAFPREAEVPRAQPTHPDPRRSALHQAHLRSPVPSHVQVSIDKTSTSLYRSVQGFAMSPKKVRSHPPVQDFVFSVPQADYDKIAVTATSSTIGAPPNRIVDETSCTYRLRGAELTPEGFRSESAWAVADTYWPEELFLTFNGAMLEPRRKLHHGRYLPIDLTPHMRVGDNRITAVVNRTSTDQRPWRYVLTVEIISARSHESIVERLTTISAVDSRAAIAKSLSATGETDDIAITSSNLTIKLFDPYSSSKIFDTPVRGAACAHRDCFDLETFLATRKRENPGWPTVVDCWRCPLCRGDVRPQSLVIDGFLVEVRKDLEERKLLDTRAIVVEADGSWKPKEQDKTGVRSDSPEHDQTGTSGIQIEPKRVVEVIEID